MSAKFQWSRLNHLQIGRYAEYFVKMEFTLYGFDVYTAEVDDKGIDFVVRSSSETYYDIQVKSIRGLSSYVFFPKASFQLRDNLFAAVVLFIEEEEPVHFLVPSTVWLNPYGPFVDRPYEGKKSPPEWGINIAQTHLDALQEFSFENRVTKLG